MKKKAVIVKVGTLVLALMLTVVFCQQEAFAGDQPKMESALKSLHKAKKQLKKAMPNKGGHRVKAIALVNEAIEEVKSGIAHANKAHKKKKLKQKKK